MAAAENGKARRRAAVSSERGARRGAGSRRTGSRRGAAAQQGGRPGMPAWVWLLLIGGPLVGIALVVIMSTMRGDPEPSGGPAVDVNAAIATLEEEVPGLQRLYVECQKLSRAEDRRAKTKQAVLHAKIDKWMRAWDEIFEPKRTETGTLPPELQSYQSIRGRVNQVRNDLLRTSNMDS